MRSAKDFFKPLALGAPEPLREIPFLPSRMIHFFAPSNPKMAAKVPDIVKTVSVDNTLESVLILAVLVTIRTMLSMSIDAEIDGVFPWRRRQLELAEPTQNPG